MPHGEILDFDASVQVAQKNKRRTFLWSIRPPNLRGGVATLSNTTTITYGNLGTNNAW
jgi:hypothetical protein